MDMFLIKMHGLASEGLY